MLDIHTILHPTDFSVSSEYAFHVACALARDYQATLHVTHVQSLPMVAFGEYGVIPPEPAESPETIQQKLESLVPVGLNVSVEYHLLEGEPAEEIVRLAKSNNIDLIIMGSHGRTGLSRLLMGSVAEQVVRRAECAVLTIKHPIHEKVQQTEKEKDYVVI